MSSHVEHAIEGTVELSAKLLQDIQNQKMDIKIAKMAIHARLVQILSLMGMNAAPSPWVRKKKTAEDLKQAIETVHSKDQVIDVIRKVNEQLK
ncbi:hypothetical protein [Effusibacillus dendaii]|uniref:Uncharacterized protein n=1 Tax=Effusibacillus dendaii TaxID=2743772 RepID=A0A7I8DH22_9BACL|nr:hypothetical protein [Effusibacillus dendaii]BCJ88186.1 hypothetical protein skT53_31710 [Effusibacillus dendaii]